MTEKCKKKEKDIRSWKLEDNEDGTYTLIVRKVGRIEENREMTITVAGNKRIRRRTETYRLIEKRISKVLSM